MQARLRRRRAILVRVAALVPALVGIAWSMGSPVATAQSASGWVAVQIYECPSGMTVSTLDPWSCWVVTDGVEAQLWSPDGTPLLGAADAYFDG